MRRISNRLVDAVPWAAAEAVISGVHGLAMVLVIGWFVGPSELGLAAAAISLVLLIESFSSAGLQDAVIRTHSGQTSVSDAGATFSQLLGVIGFAGCVVIAWPLSAVLEEPSLFWLAAAAGLTIPLNALSAIPVALLTRKLRASRLAMRLLLSKVLALVAAVLLGMMHMGPWVLIGSNLAASLGAAAALALTVRRWPRLRLDRREAKDLLSFGVISSLEATLWLSSSRLFLIVFGYAHGMNALGMLQFALRLTDELSRLLQSAVSRFGLAYFSAVVRANGDVRNAFLQGTRLLLAVGVPAFAGFAFVAPVAIPQLFGVHWAAAAAYVQILSVGWLFTFPRILVNPMLRALGRPGVVAAYAGVNAAYLLVASAVTATMTPVLGTVAWIMRDGIGLPWAASVVQNVTGVPIFRQVALIAPPYLATGIMLAVLQLLVLVGGRQDGMGQVIQSLVVGCILYPVVLRVAAPSLFADLMRGVARVVRLQG